MNDLKSSLQGIAPKATISEDDGKLISDVNLLLTGACSAALLGKKEMQLMRCLQGCFNGRDRRELSGYPMKSYGILKTK